MKQVYYGEIDLTKLGQIVRKHNALVKKKQFKDGEHQLLKITILERDEEDKFGNIATVAVSCKKDEQVQGLNYFVSDMKKPAPRDERPRNDWDNPLPPLVEEESDLPF